MRRKTVITLFFVTALILLLHQSDSEKTALVMDPISDESWFRTRSTQILRENGYTVTYPSRGEITVDYLKNITKNYNLYILRVHSTCINNRTWIFTGEKYQTSSHPILHMTDLIHRAKPSVGSEYYFAVSPEFIQQHNRDGFKDGTILMMGCEGLSSEDLAEAFCMEGATIYVSWDGNVCLQHTDQAFIALLESICVKKNSITDSITYVNTHIGRDPVYHSSLNYYPREHGSSKVS